MTMARLRKLVKDRYGKAGEIRYNLKAPDDAERVKLREESKTLREKKAVLLEEQKRLAGHWKYLLSSAEFVIDVDGGKPSMTRLLDAVKQSQRAIAVNDEISEARDRIDKINSRVLAYRVIVSINKGWCYEQAFYGDSVEDVIEKMEAKESAKT